MDPDAPPGIVELGRGVGGEEVFGALQNGVKVADDEAGDDGTGEGLVVGGTDGAFTDGDIAGLVAWETAGPGRGPAGICTTGGAVVEGCGNADA